MATTSTRRIVMLGPWGGPGGKHSWYFEPPEKIVQIFIASGDVVDSIIFGYEDEHGDIQQSEVYGGDGGSLQVIEFSEEEDIIEISGTYGEYSGMTLIKSLTFKTNNETYGPYGTQDGKSFSVPVINGKFVGFHGKYGGSLDSFGVILSPLW